jgi:hypothetical protein
VRVVLPASGCEMIAKVRRGRCAEDWDIGFRSCVARAASAHRVGARRGGIRKDMADTELVPAAILAE